MRSNWLYFETRSLRDNEPVLIWPAFRPTAISAIVESSVSPERCEMIDKNYHAQTDQGSVYDRLRDASIRIHTSDDYRVDLFSLYVSEQKSFL